jgi:hypothetical protein
MWEVKNTFNEKAQDQKENEKGEITPPTRQCRGGGARYPGSGSSDEGGEEGEITPPTLSSLCINPPPLSDIVYW